MKTITLEVEEYFYLMVAARKFELLDEWQGVDADLFNCDHDLDNWIKDLRKELDMEKELPYSDATIFFD